MTNVSLSPTLYAICNRSAGFRRRFRRGTLNVCNVARSLVYVLLVKTALLAALGFCAINGLVLLGYAMVVSRLWFPTNAVDLIIPSFKAMAEPLSYYDVSFWVFLLSTGASALWSVAITLVVLGAGALSIILPVWYGLSKGWKALDSQETSASIAKVLSPAGVAIEWVASKHNKFCLNINSEVADTTPIKEQLQLQMTEKVYQHSRTLEQLTLDQLRATVDRTHAELLAYKL